MTAFFATLRALAATPPGLLHLVTNLIVALCVCILFIAILVNFAEARSDVQRERRSIVETGTMTLFLVGIYALLRFRVGMIPIESAALRVACILAGTAIIVFGAFFNLWGRMHLKGNWANQIRIYKAQTLVTTGPYRFVRHPLYASLIWMFYGAALLYGNWAVALANTVIFLPFLWWRARLEEQALSGRFPEYAAYRRRTGMFFPRLLPHSAPLRGAPRGKPRLSQSFHCGACPAEPRETK